MTNRKNRPGTARGASEKAAEKGLDDVIDAAHEHECEDDNGAACWPFLFNLLRQRCRGNRPKADVIDFLAGIGASAIAQIAQINDLPKLVRRNTVEMAQQAGLMPKTRGVEGNELRTYLALKLMEEAWEFVESNDDMGELVDVLEVVYALAAVHGVTRYQLEAMRTEKAKTHGAFTDDTFTEGVIWFGNQARGVPTPAEPTE